MTVLKKSFAFTLAEVLITLGIIGIVAQMTIPSLMQQAGETQYYAGAKKAYSELSQALLLMSTDSSLAMDSADQFTIRDSFLKVMKTLGKGNDTELLGSTPYFGYKCTANPFLINFNQAASYSAGSGVLVVWPVTNCNNTMNENVCAEIYYDTNGLKKPNMVGYDYISFLLSKKNDEYRITPKGAPSDPWGYSCGTICGGEAVSDGCSYQRVMGLKMP